MAESRRGNKVATPKTAPAAGGAGAPLTTNTAPVVDPSVTLGRAVGARIKITTAAPLAQTYEGTLFTVCPVLNILAINTRASATTTTNAQQQGDYHVIPISRVQTFQLLSLPTESKDGFTSAIPPIGPVDAKALTQRETARVETLKDEERNRGRGVSREAQAIYDAFRKINMSIRWHNADIIVQDAVIITPPYRVEDCKGAKERQEALNRVKKILEGERRKIAEREAKAAANANAAGVKGGERKGG